MWRLTLIAVLVASVVSAAIGSYVAWSIQGGRYEQRLEQQRLTYQRAIERSEQRTRDAERQYQSAVDAALKSAAARSAALRRSADAARVELDGLRNELAVAVAAAGASPQTCPDTAAALGAVLRDVAEEGGRLAEVCDRHVNDLRTYIESSPLKD